MNSVENMSAYLRVERVILARSFSVYSNICLGSLSKLSS